LNLSRVKFGSSFDLRAQIRRSSEQKPGIRIGADGDLRLRTRFAAKRSGANRATIGAGAIPLGKSSSSSGTENLNAHFRSVAAGELISGFGILLVDNPTPPSPLVYWNHRFSGKMVF
jgi:hypothetical protein